MHDDTFLSPARLGPLTAGRDPAAATAITTAAHGIRFSGRQITALSEQISDALTRITQRLDAGRPLDGMTDNTQLAAQLDQAIMTRNARWQILTALLTPAELTALIPAPQPQTTPAPAQNEEEGAAGGGRLPRVIIRDIRPGKAHVTVKEAIGLLHSGIAVTVTAEGPPGTGPRPGTTAEVRPAGHRQPALVTASHPPGRLDCHEAAWYAQITAAAADLAGFADAADQHLGLAAAIGTAHGRHAARRALAPASPQHCQDLITRLEAGDPLVWDLYKTPALDGGHGIDYDTDDLASDTGLEPGDTGRLADAELAYFEAAGAAFWDEAETLARDCAAAFPAPGHPG